MAGSACELLDGAYLVGTEPPVFRRITPPSEAELRGLVERLAERIGRALERRGVLARDTENSYLQLEPAAGGPMDDLPRGERSEEKALTVSLGARAPPQASLL